MTEIPLIPLPFSFDDSHHRLSRDKTQTLTKFLKNLIYSSTVLFPCLDLAQNKLLAGNGYVQLNKNVSIPTLT